MYRLYWWIVFTVKLLEVLIEIVGYICLLFFISNGRKMYFEIAWNQSPLKIYGIFSCFQKLYQQRRSNNRWNRDISSPAEKSRSCLIKMFQKCEITYENKLAKTFYNETQGTWNCVILVVEFDFETNMIEKKISMLYTAFYPSALRAGGVLSSWFGRAAGRAAAKLAEPISL